MPNKEIAVKRPLWYWLRSLVESHPYIWYLAWKLSHYLPLILPHDKIYLATDHFGLAPGDLVLDVGANDGISTLSFHHVNSHLKMFSIEANAMHRGSLEKLKSRLPAFDYRIAGAGSERGNLTLYTPKYRFVNLHTFASTDENLVRKGVTEVFGKRVGKRVKILPSLVEIIPLDELRLAPRVIKIDVEGFEYFVLKGAMETLRRHRPFLILETDHDNGGLVAQLLQDLDYIILDYDHKCRVFSFANFNQRPVKLNRNHIAAPFEKQTNLPFDPSLG